MFSHAASVRRSRRYSARVALLYILAILREFRATIITLISVVAFGTILYVITPHEALGGKHPSLWTSMYASWMALLAQPAFNPPETWYLTGICGFYPLIGVILIGEGVVRLAMLMLSRRRREREWMKVIASTYRDHVVLCGVGRLGIRVLEQLVAAGVPVVALERQREGRYLARAKELDVPLMIRDMKEDQALIDAGVPHARTIIIATNDSMANLEVAIDAKQMNPKIRVVMRMFDGQIASKIASAVHIDVAFSSSNLAAPIVAAMALQKSGKGAKVLSSMLIGGVPYVVVELLVDAESPLHGQAISTLENTHKIRVLAHGRDPHTLRTAPAPHTTLAHGDTIVCHTPCSNMAFWTQSCEREREEALEASNT